MGDERDTIIFSICYAKDRSGRMYMRFGPLSQQGGERRLNVAITRAKRNIKLVGSILPSDIDLTRTQAEGVKMLRSYIEFARNGMSALAPARNADAFAAEDDFLPVVADFLTQNGYRVQRQVGLSDYKIDLAVEHPHQEGAYLAGIELDGLSYARARTARDRDHLRASVLRGMGWRLYRVWSTEWLRNPASEQQALLDFLRAAESGSSAPAPQAAVSVEAIASETTRTACADTENPYSFARYQEARLQDVPHTRSSDPLTSVAETILHVVSIEQPLHMELLYKRVSPSLSAGKATESAKNTIDAAISQRLTGQVIVDAERFIRLLPATPPSVRIPFANDERRAMEHIHTEEAAAAMLAIASSSFGLTTDDLASECARAFGFERKGPTIRQKTDAALRLLIREGRLRVIDGKAQLPSSRA